MGGWRRAAMLLRAAARGDGACHRALRQGRWLTRQAAGRVYTPRREFGGKSSLLLLLTSALAPREERLLTVWELRA